MKVKVINIIFPTICRTWNSSFFKETKIHYILLVGLIIVVGGVLLILILEEGSNVYIQTFMEAVWYIFVTISTVGYGDIYPQSTMGRFFGIFLMIIGATFFSLLTAIITPWFTQKMETNTLKETKKYEKKIEERLNNIENQLKKYNHKK